MTVHPALRTSIIRGGIAAYAREIGLAGHGPDETEAVAVATGAVQAWCRALAKTGSLERALTRRGIRWDSAGDGIIVTPQVEGVASSI